MRSLKSEYLQIVPPCLPGKWQGVLIGDDFHFTGAGEPPASPGDYFFWTDRSIIGVLWRWRGLISTDAGQFFLY